MPDLTVHDLETPSVLIDLDRMQHNINRTQARCDSLGLRLRPHVTIHKIPEIARMQAEAGGVGIACQKVSEAEIFARAGFNDIQITYNIVGLHKTARLADLALFNRVTVTADHPNIIAGLADAASANEITIRVLVELKTDLARTGVAATEVVALAQRIEREENLHFAGLLVYPSALAVRPSLQQALFYLNKAGIGVDIVSGGGTAVIRQAQEVPEVTELCAGTYIFNDWRSVVKHYADMDDCAMTVTATVVSRPTPERVILDAGSRTLGADTVDGGHGFVLEYPDAFIYKLSPEHAHVDMSRYQDLPVIGERVHIIPVHAAIVTNLANEIYGMRGDTVEVTWPIAARGFVW